MSGVLRANLRAIPRRSAPTASIVCTFLVLTGCAQAPAEEPASEIRSRASDSRSGIPGPGGVESSATPAGTPATGGSSAGSTPAASRRPRIVVLGDSLTAGLGISPSEAFPAQLQKQLDAAGYLFEVVNMGVSGDTSAGGLRRLDWALEGDVRILVLALGANDGLRGLSPADLERNLEAMIDKAEARKIQVLLCGMEAPPNFGERYTHEFREVYARLASRKQVALLPFLLDGVAGITSLNQPDGIHPSPEGARRVAELVWVRLQPLLSKAEPS